MKYLLDANVFIQAKNMHYGLDFCPAFWDWITTKNTEGVVYSIDKVSDELNDKQDELASWNKLHGARLYLNTDKNVYSHLTTVSNWVDTQRYEQSAVSEFFSKADYYLIGHALVDMWVIVTHEKPSGSTKKIKIPDVCRGLGVECISTFDMLRREHARFDLRGKVNV